MPMLGKIVFAKNPWPKGHALKEVRWAGRIDPKTGVWFDLHMQTADYDANDKEDEEDEDEDVESDWDSKSVWNNYHRCTLSSLHWGQHSGFLVGTKKEP